MQKGRPVGLPFFVKMSQTGYKLSPIGKDALGRIADICYLLHNGSGVTSSRLTNGFACS